MDLDDFFSASLLPKIGIQVKEDEFRIKDWAISQSHVTNLFNFWHGNLSKIDTSDNSIESTIVMMLEEQLSLSYKGTAEDKIPNCTGQFGFDSTNPIPTFGIFGTNDYLNNLIFEDGSDVSYSRDHSLSVEGIAGNIDCYSIFKGAPSSDDDLFCKLYVHPYNRNDSRDTPIGFRQKNITKMVIPNHINIGCLDWCDPVREESSFRLLCDVRWSWSPAHSRHTKYFINEENDNFSLYALDYDDNEMEWKCFLSACTKKSKLSLAEAADYLLFYFWQNEKNLWELDKFHFIDELDFISEERIDFIANSVWRN